MEHNRTIQQISLRILSFVTVFFILFVGTAGFNSARAEGDREDDGFRDADTETLVLPDSVKDIQEEAFYQDAAIGKVRLPEGVETIGYSAFAESALKEITFPEGLKKIEGKAFGSTGLTRVFIPASLTELAPTAFSGANSLNEIIFDENHPSYMSRNGLIYDKTGSKLISSVPALSGEVSVPEGVTSIGSEAFSGRSLITRVVLPASVTEMGVSTFEGCTGLTSAEIRGQIRSLPYASFFGCEKLTALSLPDTVTEIGEQALAMSGLRSITLPPAVKTLKRGALYGCPDLKTIILPDGLTSLGDDSISHNPKLTSVSIPASVTSISDGNFDQCPLAVIRTPKNSYAWIWAKEHQVAVEELAFS